MCVYLIHCDDFANVFSHSCFRWMSLDERFNVALSFAFAVFVLHVDDIACSESCKFSKDGYCDDGGSGSDYDICASGTDCEVGRPSKNDLSKRFLFCV